MSYFNNVTINQNVTIDANNSSTANLSASQIFTGTATTTLGVNGIQVSLKTDQNCRVYIEQAPDLLGHWDVVDEYEYYAAINNFGVTVQAVNSYIRVRVQNISLSTTSYFRLQTALCPIVEALPRSLDEDGCLKVSVRHTSDEYEWEVENTPMNEMRVAIPTRLVGVQFEGSTIDTNFWSATGYNSATTTQLNGEMTLSTGTNSAGAATLNTVRRARYVPGSANGYRSVVQLGDTGVANNVKRWGVAAGSTSGNTLTAVTDGAWFTLSGTQFGITTMKAGTATDVFTGSFNGGLGATFAVDTNVKTYEIYWTNSSVWFTVGGDVIHTVSASTATWASTMSFYVYMDNVNSGNTTNTYIKSRVASIRRLGQLLTQPTSKYLTGTTTSILKYGTGNLHSVVIGAVPTSGAVITLYDGTSAAGTIICSFTIAFPGGGNFNPQTIDLKGVPFYNGLFVAITVQAATITVVYE